MQQAMRLGAFTVGLLAFGVTACGADTDGGDPIDELSNELVTTTHGNINCGGPTVGGVLINGNMTLRQDHVLAYRRQRPAADRRSVRAADLRAEDAVK